MALRAAILDRKVYEKVEDDDASMRRAISVVFTAAIGFGVGARTLTPSGIPIPESAEWMLTLGLQNVIMLTAISTTFLSWVVWSAIAFYVGSKLLRGVATYKTTIRAMGLAYAPVTLLVFLPISRYIDDERLAPYSILLLVTMWLVATTTIAIKETQKTNWLKVSLPVIFGWFVGWMVLLFEIAWPLIFPGGYAFQP